jgi:hypothetical protein
MTETLDNPPRNHESPPGESELATDNRWFGNLLVTHSYDMRLTALHLPLK